MSPSTASVRSVDRALDILELLGSRNTLTLGEVAQFLGLPKSSTHSILTTLVGRGYVAYSLERREYAMGIRSWELGQRFKIYDALLRSAVPQMRELVDEIDETCQMAVRDGTELVYLHRIDSTRPMQLITSTGRRLDACHAAGIGKALLSGLADDELEELYRDRDLFRFTPQTITDLATLKLELGQIRASGVAEDREECTQGVRCVAAPILDSHGLPIAGISVSVPPMRFSETWRRSTVPRLLERARAVSVQLGARVS